MQLRHAAVPWRALSWTVVETVEEILASWQALAARAPDQPFQHPAWIAAWLETRGRVLAVRPRIVVGHHRDSCEIVVPLGITGRGPGRVLRWLAGDSSDYNAPLASPELRASFPPDDAAAFWGCIADLAGPAAVPAAPGGAHGFGHPAGGARGSTHWFHRKADRRGGMPGAQPAASHRG